jgi:hypothetical protein
MSSILVSVKETAISIYPSVKPGEAIIFLAKYSLF